MKQEIIAIYFALSCINTSVAENTQNGTSQPNIEMQQPITAAQVNNHLNNLWQDTTVSYEIIISKVYDYCASLLPYTDLTLEHIYRVRNYISKERLKADLKTLAPQYADHPYAAILRHYLATEQATVGDNYVNIRATDFEGKPFDLSRIIGKKELFLIFGGLGCMGSDALGYLKELYAALNTKKAQIISLSLETDSTELESECEHFQIPWPVVCDMKGDFSPAKIAYGVQATPTCVHIDKKGKIIHLDRGLDMEFLQKIFNFKRSNANPRDVNQFFND